MIRALAAPDDTPAPTPPGASRGNPLTGATETALPGLATFKGLVLGLIPYALVACVAAFLIGAILWAVGAFGNNPQHSSRGKTTLIVALAAALLVGGAGYLGGLVQLRRQDGVRSSVVHRDRCVGRIRAVSVSRCGPVRVLPSAAVGSSSSAPQSLS